MTDNSPCICGHALEFHHFDGDGNNSKILLDLGNSWCMDCSMIDRRDGRSFKPFHNYKIDNLKYLEQLSVTRQG